MGKRLESQSDKEMSTLELREVEPVREIGYIAEVSGNGVKAVCNLKTLRDMSDIDSGEAEFSPGQIGTILKIKVSKGFLFVTVRDVIAIQEQGKILGKVEMRLDFLGHGIRAPMTETGMIFDRGVTDFPIPGQPVYPVTLADVEGIFGDNDSNHFHLGHVFPQHITPASINIDALLGKHFSILGSTGTGKSCTVALLIRRIVERLPDAHIIMLDPHNEYETAFSDCAMHFDINNLRLPYWMMNFEEHCEMFIGYNSKDRMIETDVLRRCLFEARVDNNEHISPELITVDTPIPYKLSYMMAFLDQEMGKLDNPETLTPYLRLKNKIDELRRDTRFGFMFSGMLVNDTLNSIIGELLRFPVNNKPVSTIDLSGVPSEIVNVVVSVISRTVFDFAVWSRGNDARPILLVCEEAHRYVPTDNSTIFNSTRKAIERIAKEGRKYGVSMGLVSQRPAELSESALSQCGTIFAMRMNNERDQRFVAHVLPEGAEGSLNSLSSLQNREALAVGEGVEAPVRLLVDKLEKEHLPSSGSPSYSVDWQKGLEDPDFVDQTIEIWRKAGQ